MCFSTRRALGFCSQNSGTILAPRLQGEVDKDGKKSENRVQVWRVRLRGPTISYATNLDIKAIPMIVSCHRLVVTPYLRLWTAYSTLMNPWSNIQEHVPHNYPKKIEIMLARKSYTCRSFKARLHAEWGDSWVLVALCKSPSLYHST